MKNPEKNQIYLKKFLGNEQLKKKLRYKIFYAK